MDKKTDSNIKTNEIKKKNTEQDNDKYITAPEFNKLTAEPARLAQANLGNKNAIANFVKKDRF